MMPSHSISVVGMSKIVQWIRPEIRDLSAYHVQNAAGLIKLDAMENPYTWPQALRDEWAALLSRTDVNRYPDPQAAALTARLAEAMDVPQSMRLLLGNGSDEIIQMIMMSLLGDKRCVLSVEPGFVMYRMIATFCGMDYVGVPLHAEDFSLDMPALLQAIEKHQPAAVFLAYPNNPTGNLFADSDIRQVIEAAPGLVVVDEAYAPFTDASFMSRLGEYDNLVVMRTVSKMGLAGLRLGLLAGSAEWLDEFDKVRLPYNVNVLTQISASFALAHKAVFDGQTTQIRVERERLLKAFAELPDVQVFPSQSNFILLRTAEGRAKYYFDGLKEQGVLIKNLHGAHPLLADCLRPTVGTPDENTAMLEAFQAIAIT
jgi:histidinol-phosphate aminotransferase